MRVVQPSHGAWISKPSNKRLAQLSRLGFFLIMFPPKSLRHIVILTNTQLAKCNFDKIDMGKFLRWFAIVLLISKC